MLKSLWDKWFGTPDTSTSISEDAVVIDDKPEKPVSDALTAVAFDALDVAMYANNGQIKLTDMIHTLTSITFSFKDASLTAMYAISTGHFVETSTGVYTKPGMRLISEILDEYYDKRMITNLVDNESADAYVARHTGIDIRDVSHAIYKSGYKVLKDQLLKKACQKLLDDNAYDVSYNDLHGFAATVGVKLNLDKYAIDSVVWDNFPYWRVMERKNEIQKAPLTEEDWSESFV